MSWIQDVEQLIPLIKPVSYVLRSAQDLFTRTKPERSGHGITIPKKTLILVPGAHSYALRWGMGKAGDRGGMRIGGLLRATNTSEFGIRPAGIKLLLPKKVEVLTAMATVKDPKSGMHSHKYLIPPRSIGEVSFMFFVVPVKGVPGKTLSATVSILDQFGNEHVSRNLQCKFVGPEKWP
jgi:hypothetical protein